MGSVKGVVMGVVVIFVSLILFALIITQTDAVLDAIGASAYEYTGVEEFALLVPLLVLLGLMGFGGWQIYHSVRSGGGGRKKRR